MCFTICVLSWTWVQTVFSSNHWRMDHSSLLSSLVCKIPPPQWASAIPLVQWKWLSRVRLFATPWTVAGSVQFQYACIAYHNCYPIPHEEQRLSARVKYSFFSFILCYKVHSLSELLKWAPSPTPFSEVVLHIANTVILSHPASNPGIPWPPEWFLNFFVH